MSILQRQKVNTTRLEEERLSTQKINYIKDLAFKIKQEEINLTEFDNFSGNNVYDILIKVKGIGEWTINNYRLFTLFTNLGFISNQRDIR